LKYSGRRPRASAQPNPIQIADAAPSHNGFGFGRPNPMVSARMETASIAT
jgi:hypothetical protein